MHCSLYLWMLVSERNRSVSLINAAECLNDRLSPISAELVVSFIRLNNNNIF